MVHRQSLVSTLPFIFSKECGSCHMLSASEEEQMMENITRLLTSTFEMEYEQMESFILKQAAIYMSLAALGIILNLGVLTRLMRVFLTQSDQFFEGCAMPLSVMALSDLLSLISMIVLVPTSVPFSPSSSTFGWLHTEIMEMVKCKVRNFVFTYLPQRTNYQIICLSA